MGSPRIERGLAAAEETEDEVRMVRGQIVALKATTLDELKSKVGCTIRSPRSSRPVAGSEFSGPKNV